MFRAAIGIVVVATLVGVLMPARGPSRGETTNAAAAPLPVPEPRTSGAQGWGSSRSEIADDGEVRLTRQGNGHFYADVEVNGTTLEFMIDTGATGVAMTEEDALRAGVPLSAAQNSYVGEGAGGALTGKVVSLDRVRLGDKTANAMPAVVIDGASTNLLGQSFLARFSEVTVRGDVMTLR
ncbi:TIGR02281 family clan AA aspartic protease [Sphingomonas sp. LHG3406-1]|uniref:retropepsin-like aspartic protease family protein n=1 Tax=Sphingomonas sp. LHG3406-1 TaxID=2804617 RepID=UPI00262EC5A1|nr:TIGR02281 family clan AA aspartic protease [Sphingomonas sp. LHG3406-1]